MALTVRKEVVCRLASTTFSVALTVRQTDADPAEGSFRLLKANGLELVCEGSLEELRELFRLLDATLNQAVLAGLSTREIGEALSCK